MAVDPQVTATAKQIATEIGSTILQRLFGIAPRGNFQKFQRTVYPLMAAQSRSAQVPVYAFWFGDLVEVRPDGSFGVVASPGNLDAALSIIGQWHAQGRKFYLLRVPAGTDFNDLQILSAVADMEPHNLGGLLDWIPGLGGGSDVPANFPGTPSAPPVSSGGILQAGVPLVIAVIIGFLILRR